MKKSYEEAVINVQMSNDKNIPTDSKVKIFPADFKAMSGEEDSIGKHGYGVIII